MAGMYPDDDETIEVDSEILAEIRREALRRGSRAQDEEDEETIDVDPDALAGIRHPEARSADPAIQPSDEATSEMDESGTVAGLPAGATSVPPHLEAGTPAAQSPLDHDLWQPPARLDGEQSDAEPMPAKKRSGRSGGTRLWIGLVVGALIAAATVVGVLWFLGRDEQQPQPPEEATPTIQPPEETTPTTQPPEETTPTTQPPEEATPTTQPPEETTPTTQPRTPAEDDSSSDGDADGVLADVTAESSGDGAGLSVRWAAPSWDKVERFRVQWRGPGEGYSESREHIVSSAYISEVNSHRISGLDSGVVYTIRVRAEATDGVALAEVEIEATVSEPNSSTGSSDSDDETDPGSDRVDRVLFTRGDPGDVFEVDSDGGNEQQLTDSVQRSEVARSISPDGAWVIVDSRETGDWEIWAIETTSGDRRQLTCNSVNDWSAKWSHDGTSIVFVSGVSRNHDLVIMEVASGETWKLTDGASDDHSPSWSPDGRQVAFARGVAGSRDIWIVDVRTKALTRLTSSGRDNAAPSWSPDGETIAFASGFGPDRDIVIIDANGANQRAVTSGSHHDDAPSWSPDSSQIVFARGQPPNRILMVVDIVRGATTELVGGALDIHNPVWVSPPGSTPTPEPVDCAAP